MKRILPLGFCMVFLFIQARSQDPPVAVSDSYFPIVNISQDTLIDFNILLNDYDPDGSTLRILEVKTLSGVPWNLFTDNTVSFEFTGINDLAAKTLMYRICELNDPASVSNWARVVVNAGMSVHAPVAESDTGITIPWYSSYINVLANDTDPDGDSLAILPQNHILVNDSTLKFLTDPAYFTYFEMGRGYKKFNYIVSDTTPWALNFDVGEIYIGLEHHAFYDSVDVNNINARFNSFGNHFWDMPGGEGPHFYVPDGSTKQAVFSNTLWLGGLDYNNQLHLAAERYRQVGEDFFSGPLADLYDSLYDIRWFHAWKLNREEIAFHRDNWWKPDYVCPEDIFSWPGNGDVNYGEAQQLAPYCDYNENGLYDPLEGDYPYIRGDQAVFFIFNDARKPHTETQGASLGIEVHGMAYAYDEPADSALWNTLFLHYDIINRSLLDYHETYLASFTDMDLGYAWDDFTGCNVEGGYYYAYNGTPVDGNGEPESYGEHPPAIGILVLGGPTMDEDGIDNPSGQCDASINGLNFGDTIVDNERLGLTRFSCFNNTGMNTGDPSLSEEYFQYLGGYWKDNTQIIYGGNGHESSGALGPACRFMYPDDSDSCNWGTNGVWPNGGYNQNGLFWNETTVGNVPGDRRGLGISGPFTFQKEEVVQLDLAFVFARDFSGNNLDALDILEDRCAYLKNMFEYNEDFFSRIPGETAFSNPSIRVFPNPASERATFMIPENKVGNSPVIFVLSTIDGKQLNVTRFPGGSRTFSLDLGGLKPGMYFYSARNEHEILGSGKIIKE